MSAAITARKNGASVLVLEKDRVIGGTTARSGGVLWIPGNSLSRNAGIADDEERATSYLRHATGQAFDARRVQAFLRNGPRMVDWFQKETSVKFVAVPEFPDYHPDTVGGLPGGRSILAAPFDGRELGKRFDWLRPPLREITFVGMMFNASQEIRHFFNVTRSLRSACYVAKRLTCHMYELVMYRRAVRLTNGNALAARLAKTLFDLEVQFELGAQVEGLEMEQGRVIGVTFRTEHGLKTVSATKGVILAAGGFPQDLARRKELFGPAGEQHMSPAPKANTGDGLRLAETVGGVVDATLPNPAAWIPVSRVAHSDGTVGAFPHLIDRYKPGVVMVNRGGLRFTNESNSYHDVGIAMREACVEGSDMAAFLICDSVSLKRYGLGYVKPHPVLHGHHLRSGYLLKANSLSELAQTAGIDPVALQQTLEEFNEGARQGVDRQFGRGESAYNRFLGDAQHSPNPCVAPLERGPFYAIRVGLGDLGTFAGISTDEYARVLDQDRKVVDGLYAVGNDAVSVMGGAYPGGGITLGPAMTFGFVAGEHVANTAKPAADVSAGHASRHNLSTSNDAVEVPSFRRALPNFW